MELACEKVVSTGDCPSAGYQRRKDPTSPARDERISSAGHGLSFAPVGLWVDEDPSYPPLKRWAILRRPCGTDPILAVEWVVVLLFTVLSPCGARVYKMHNSGILLGFLLTDGYGEYTIAYGKLEILISKCETNTKARMAQIQDGCSAVAV
jgi:hypothetical protein